MSSRDKITPRTVTDPLLARMHAALLAIVVIGSTSRIALSQVNCEATPELTTAATADDARSAYAGILFGKDDEVLHALQSSDCDGIALQATWCRIAIKSARDLKIGSQSRIPTADALRFVGFVEGRLRISPPSWFEHACRNLFVEDFGNDIVLAHCRSRAGVGVPQLTDKVKGEIYVNDRIRVRDINDSTVTITLEDDREVLIPRLRREGDIVIDAISISPERIVSYTGSSQLIKGEIACTNGVDGKIVWRQKVFGGGIINLQGGIPRISVTLVHDRGRIIVFAREWGAICIEAFDAEKGESLFRFSTAYGLTPNLRAKK